MCLVLWICMSVLRLVAKETISSCFQILSILIFKILY